MINKPYSLLPSDLEDGSGVVDIAKQTTFSFQATGTSPIYMIALEMCDISGTPTTSLFFSQTSPIYYTNIDGSDKTVKVDVTAEQLNLIAGNSYEQQWRVIVWDSTKTEYTTSIAQYADGTVTTGEFEPNYAVASDWAFVQLKTTPSVSVTTSGEISVKYNTWTATYTPSYTYENKTPTTDATSMRSVRWQVFDTSSSESIYDTGEIFGCVEPSYSVDGLRNRHTYYAVITIVDQDGVSVQSVSDPVSVVYDEPTSGIMTLLYTNEIDGYMAKYGTGQEIVLNVENFSGQEGRSSNGPSGYDIENIGEPIGYVLENKTGNTITYTDIDDKDADIFTVRFLFTPVPYKPREDIVVVYLDDEETDRVRYAISNEGGLTPSESLTPSETLKPEVRYYFIAAYRERLVDGEWVVVHTELESIDLESMAIDEFYYYENVACKIYDLTGTSWAFDKPVTDADFVEFNLNFTYSGGSYTKLMHLENSPAYVVGLRGGSIYTVQSAAITGGTDAMNTDAIKWLLTNATQL